MIILFFTLKEIGLEISRLERYKEDLWITKGGRKEVIVEVKGTKSNFTRKHLNDLDNHREENKLNDDVPALLIANTFSEANSLSEKDREPARGDTLRRTKAQKIMIMKSLDIFNLYLLIKSNKIEVEDFFTVLKGKECGCIKVNDKIELIKK